MTHHGDEHEEDEAMDARQEADPELGALTGLAFQEAPLADVPGPVFSCHLL
ncbi:MAG: hypothetical protein M0Z46_05205 [Actinomycetota bacterium]|nr:hypothetical protein [Actinomycetota bacterium]